MTTQIPHLSIKNTSNENNGVTPPMQKHHVGKVCAAKMCVCIDPSTENTRQRCNYKTHATNTNRFVIRPIRKHTY